jgi:3-oxoadipate enol-lactonase
MNFRPPQFVDHKGRRLAYEEAAPDAPARAVVLLCGIGGKRQGWYEQLPVFGRRFRTLALDYRDTGDSDPGPVPYTIGDVAADVRAFLDALRIADASLVGVSMGGFVALELALSHPELVDRLVLVCTSAGGPTHVSTSPEIMRLLMPGDEEVETGEGARRVCSAVMAPGVAEVHPEYVETFVEIAQHRPLRKDAYLAQLAACRGHDVSDRLAEIGAETLVVHGELDPLVPAANGRHLAERLPNARLLMYPDTGHIPQVERSAEFNRDVIEFLES